MAKETKFSDDELKSLSDLAQGYQTTQAAFGQLRVQKILLAQQQDGLEEAEVKLEADYITLQENERKVRQRDIELSKVTEKLRLAALKDKEAADRRGSCLPTRSRCFAHHKLTKFARHQIVRPASPTIH